MQWSLWFTLAHVAFLPCAIAKRRVNFWFNALNSSFGVHQAAVALAHRKSLTGVYQYIQPNGFIIRSDGSVALPPEKAIADATGPLLAEGLESGVCVPIPPETLLSGNATKAIPTLIKQAVKWNITTFIMDVEPSPGVNGSIYCTNSTAHIYADFLQALTTGMHAVGKRTGMCIEMGCILGPEFWSLYASTGVDVMMSMGSTYYAHTPTSNISTNEGWLRRELAVVGPVHASQLAVGIGSVSVPDNPACWPPHVPSPWPDMYGWNQSSFSTFMAFIQHEGFLDVDLFRADWAQCTADCVPQYYYDALQAFLLLG